MFGAIVASRPVLTEIQTISQTQFAFTIPSQPSFSHIVIFLLPGQVLPDGAAAAVYIRLFPSQDFRLLGAIANDKQSAIFKFKTGATSGLAGQNTTDPGDDVMIDDATAQPVDASAAIANIVVGISIEPAENIRAQLAALKNQTATASSESSGLELIRHQAPAASSSVPTKILAQRIIKNAFNFLSSFAGGSGGNETVPLKAFQDWWTKFEKRITLDPSFLEKEQD